MAVALVLTEREKNYAILVAVVIVLSYLIPSMGESYGLEYLRDQQRQQKKLNQDIDSLNSRLEGIEDERRLLLANREDYLRWVNRGVVGEPDPVDWIKSLQNIQKERKLFPISYKFDDQRRLASDDSHLTMGSSVQISTLRMNFDMKMLHDLDAFMLMQSLSRNSQNSSLFFPTECRFSRITEDFTLSNRENLSADCKIDWVSVYDPEKNV